MYISSDFRRMPTDLFRRWTIALLFWSWLSVLFDGSNIGALAKSTIHHENDDTLYRPGASFTDQVSFDNYSLSLRGQRIFLHSGEFHTFRLPVPSLWPDILQKVKASGLNAVSVYVHMGLLNPSRGVVDFDGFRVLKPLYEAALEAGIWIALCPETSAGDIAHWATSEVAGMLRTSTPDWREAWMDYILGIIKETTPYQITEGGPVIAIQIDNEFTQSVGGEYFAELEEVYQNSSIVLPLTYNDPGQGRNFVNGTSAVDLYELDSYPQGFDCSHPLDWQAVPLDYHQYHEEVNPSQPWYFPEFQGGAVDGWGPAAPAILGYSSCAVLTGTDFMSVFYLQLWASNAKLFSYYMLYGFVYTSYDYGASLKRQGLFVRSSPEFYKTDWIADSSTGLSILSSDTVFATYLLNPDTQSGFYIVRHNDSTSTDITDFKINVATAEGDLQIPIVASAVILGGRQSKVIVTNYAFGSSQLLDILFIYGDTSQEHEIALLLTGRAFRKNYDISSFRAMLTPSCVITIFSFPTLVLFADSDTVATFWAPSIIVGGPYLVHLASISGTELALKGDLNASTPLTIIAPAVVSSVTWNGAALSVNVSSSLTAIGGLVGELSLSSASVDIAVAPTLEGWKFDDGSFVVANHTTTNIPRKPYYSDGTILYGCDYGFCENVQSLNLSINGGSAFAASVWLNNVFLKTSYGNSTNNINILEETDAVFTFPEGAVLHGDNVITIVQDNMGLNETSGTNPDSSKSPRGIRGFQLNSSKFTQWRVQGKIGGYTDYTRGVFNEGGLYGERKGWHLPGFDTSSWEALASFVRTFDLHIPEGFDPLGQTYRAYLFVNGWMMSKRIGKPRVNWTPQAKFPVHQGILDYSGTNTVAVALWAMEANATIAPDLQLSGLDGIVTNNPRWSPAGRV
ncbi:glycoside hydrolase family 35 protein [Desarmillaria tabescens]|uniref:beta-galactosidase n=1 Tax=Armillaria tabescens TaxID=1929756 RepID=A0AA39MVB4_ARMTA|nr:glycoside hydrolase family 35 protein [Desarmillaria tabescens]KAK0448411.1 glycoside hydrolase family 35 protein [Desarmillaria tabescens]